MGIIKKSIDKNDDLQYDGLSVIELWKQEFKYVIMEDHSNPYLILGLDDLSFPELQGDWKIDSFVVPLYKHVFVSAEDACSIVERIISQTSDRVRETIHEEDLVLNLFLIASRVYKEYRISHANNNDEKIFYSQMNYPKYLWVTEYSTKAFITKGCALGEYVIDATASKPFERSDFSAVISIRHGADISFRNPYDKTEDVVDPYDIALGNDFEIYKDNNSVNS